MRTRINATKTATSFSASRRGFTLVELLVVIGIIALLISILLPSLNRARAAAKQVACLSQLRQIGTAMQLHAQDHVGFLPIAGYVHGVDATPDGLGDTSRRRYSYYQDTVIRPLTLSGALSPYLGRRIRMDNRATVQAEQNDPNSLIRKIFTCPAELTTHYGLSIKSKVNGVSWTGPTMYSSYAFNEALLSYSHNGAGTPGEYECLRGQLSRIKQPSRTVLLCDNFVRDTSDGSYFTIFSNSCPATMAEAYFNQNGAGPDKVSFDRIRHSGRMNYLAADMHGEAAMLPSVNATFSTTGPLSDLFIISN